MLVHNTKKKITEGTYYPLGANLTAEGANFAIYSKHAQEVFLLLFDEAGAEPTDIIKLGHMTKNIWHVFVHGVNDGQLYGYKIQGPYDPKRGLRFNENKFLLDPYAKALTGKVVNRDDALFGYDANSAAKDLSFDTRDTTAIMPKCIVVDDTFDWEGDKPPNIHPGKSIIYETHLKGFTAHPSSKVKKPGTYLGFIEKIPYLKGLGITAVEFLPLQEFYHEDFLVKKGLSNYWGYNTIGYFAPESSYASTCKQGAQVKEFKTLVKELHKAGIEVIMDVVYNHTGEGDELGPTISFRGIDNPTYYCLKGPGDEPARRYYNYSGCGNCINPSDPHVIRFILDSMRYWVEVMHVDGFRFDLASILGREEGGFKDNAPFFYAVTQEPALNRIKLIAEPWDLETYQVGGFPIDWSEWNGRFRDTVRKFMKGDPGQISDLRYRLSGSPDLYGEDGRTANNSINFVTSHDGLTLYDLVSYDRKHNEANLENNKDGRNENNSWNCGVEGETNDPAILALRRQLAKNYMCMLLLSSGTPMLLAGDEFLRTQKGNNNAYCQDNELNWINWDLARKNADFLKFCKEIIAMANRYKVLQMRKYSPVCLAPEVTCFEFEWFGKNLDEPAWDDPSQKTLALYLYTEEKGEEGHEFLAIFNQDAVSQQIKLPQIKGKRRWHRRIDASLKQGEDCAEPGKEVLIDPPEYYIVNPHSTVILIGR